MRITLRIGLYICMSYTALILFSIVMDASERKSPGKLDLLNATCANASKPMGSSQIHDTANLYSSDKRNCSDSAQVTHPSLLYAPDGWHGWKLWLVYSPVTSCRGAGDENPRLICSNDGSYWQVPSHDSVSIENPLFRPGRMSRSISFLSDAELFWSSDSTMWLVFRANFGRPQPDSIGLYFSHTYDGVEWSLPELSIVKREVRPGHSPLMSPAVYLREEGLYEMLVVDGHMGFKQRNHLIRYETNRPDLPWRLTDTIDLPVVRNMSSKVKQHVWHIEIIPVQDKLFGLFTMGDIVSPGAHATLYLGESLNAGKTWQLVSRPLLLPRDGQWDSDRIYRSTGYFSQNDPANGFVLYYSACGGTNLTWHMGQTKIRFSGINRR